MLQAGQGQQGQPRGVLRQQAPQQPRPLTGPGVRHRHADDVLPLRVARVAREDVEVALLDRVPRAQVVLEGAVDEVQ
ncbi:hypothetical protein RKD48_003671 [Streptomyces ambofaciens]